MAEKKSSIERELNLIKASLSSKPEAKILENPETVQKLKSIENKQKHFIDKQKHIIDELRKTKFSQRSKLSKKYVWFIIVPLQGPTHGVKIHFMSIATK